jgi:hypothetical protein
VLTAVAVLSVVRELWPEEFHWLEPPYEYEARKAPIDILAGGTWLRQGIDAGQPPQAMLDAWSGHLAAFGDEVAESLHYE